MTQTEAIAFEAKVRSMPVWEIIRAMIRGLKRRWVKIDMSTYGTFRWSKNDKYRICYGCAATNAVCEIIGRALPPDAIASKQAQANYLQAGWDFLDDFERGINDLRSRDLHGFNINMGRQLLSTIPEAVIEARYKYDLLSLGNCYTDEDLDKYEQLAQACEEYAKSKEVVPEQV